jgi:hypothetical protein
MDRSAPGARGQLNWSRLSKSTPFRTILEYWDRPASVWYPQRLQLRWMPVRYNGK